MTLRITAATYRHFDPRSGDPAANMEATAGAIVADVLDLDARGLLANVRRHYLCSTVLGIPLNYGVMSWTDMAAKMHARLGKHAPAALINIYECASWGYLLDYWFRKCRRSGAVLISIVDCNFLDLREYDERSEWGASGWGYAQLCIEDAATVADDTIGVDATSSDRALMEFCAFARRRAQTRSEAINSLPFNLPDTRQMMVRYMGAMPILPDLYATWGHCFGADPWIGVVNDQLARRRTGETQERLYHVCSNGLGGFFATAYVTADASTFVELR